MLESEIEASIISNPEILEEGVELVGNQYPTSVGYIDILCRDKNGNFVVVELKRGAGSYKAVGQIQRRVLITPPHHIEVKYEHPAEPIPTL